MKHWIEGSSYGQMPDKVISLAINGDDEESERVLAIGIKPDGLVEFREQCDSWFGTSVPPMVAIELLEEAIAWIRRDAVEQPNDKLTCASGVWLAALCKTHDS